MIWNGTGGAGALAVAALLVAEGSGAARAEALPCQALVTALAEEGRVALDGVTFDFNRATLRPDSLPALVAARDAILALGGDWRIEGHTDSVGSHAYNQALSEARAGAVRDWLVAAGVPASSLTAQGFGFDRPVAPNDSEAGRAQNRRVELAGAVAPGMAGFGGPAGVDPCPATLTPGTTAVAELPPPPVTDWTGTDGPEWLPFAYLMTTGDGAAEGWRGERLSMLPGTQPQACQALCLANEECAAFSFEPAGSFFVAEARCLLLGYGTEVDLMRDNGYFGGGTHFAAGLKPDARILTPQSETLAAEILADMAEVAALRARVRLMAPETAPDGDWLTVAISGAADPGRFPSYVEIAELDDYAFDWSKSRSSLPVTVTDGVAGDLLVPEPGDFVLRYVIDHPTAGRHSIAEQLLRVAAGADTSAPGAVAATLDFPMVVAPGEQFTVSFTGPRFPGDWIDMIGPGNDEDMSGGFGWAWAEGGSVELTAPEAPGEYLLRYVAEHPELGRTVAGQEVLVVRAGAAPVPGPGAAPAAAAAAEEVAFRCDGAGFAPCEIRVPEVGLSLSLMPGYGITRPERPTTAAGEAAGRPVFDVVRLADSAVIATVNPRQASSAFCFPATLDTICTLGAPAEADMLALLALVGSLEEMAAAAQPEPEPDTAAAGPMQGIWFGALDMPGNPQGQALFLLLELMQDAGNVAVSGSFVTAPDLGPAPGLSGDVTGAVAGETLNLSLVASDGMAMVFSGAPWGGDAWRGQLMGSLGSAMQPVGAILRLEARPGEDWSGPPWMTGAPEGMAAALGMGAAALEGLLSGDGFDGNDRAMLEMLGALMGGGAAPAAPDPAAPSPQMRALGGTALADLDAEEALILFAPHLLEAR